MCILHTFIPWWEGEGKYERGDQATDFCVTGFSPLFKHTTEVEGGMG